MSETLNSGSISTKLERVAELARKHPERAFMSLADSVCKWTTGEGARPAERQGWLARARGYLTGS